MISGQPLPPIRVALTGIPLHCAGSRRVENGFHRYFASLALGYTEIPVLQQNVVKDALPRHSTFDENRKQQDTPIIIEGVTEKGSPISLEATVLVGKREGFSEKKTKERNSMPAPSKPRWEPRVVREARLKREEQERLKREEQERRKKHLEQLEALYVSETLSKKRLDKETCMKMADYSSGSNMTYAEKALGRSKPGPPPSWEVAFTVFCTAENSKVIKES